MPITVTQVLGERFLSVAISMGGNMPSVYAYYSYLDTCRIG